MKKHFALLAAGIAATLAGSASAQLFEDNGFTFEQVITEAQFTTLSGLSSTEPDCVAVSPDGTTVYSFDSASNQDSIVKYDIGTTTLTTFVTETELTDAAGGGTPSVSMGDLDIDSAGNLYVYCRTPSGSDYQLFKIDPSANITVMADSSSLDGLQAIAVDETNSRIVLSFSDTFATSAAQDVKTLPLNAVNGTPTTLAAEAAIQAAVTPNSTEIEPIDLVVLSDGTIIYVNGYNTSAGEARSDILQISPAGAVSMFLDSSTILTQLGATPGTDTLGRVFVEAFDNDKVFIGMTTAGSGTTALDDFFGIASADGSVFEILISEDDLLALSGVPAGMQDIQFSASDFGPEVDSDNNIWWASQAASGFGVFKLSGFDVNVVGPLNADNWSMYR